MVLEGERSGNYGTYFRLYRLDRYAVTLTRYLRFPETAIDEGLK